MTNSGDYDFYINSEEWRQRTQRIRSRDGYRCCICGADNVPLEVHHLTYDRLYHEQDDDLLTVCHECHEKITKSWHSMKDGLKTRRRYFRCVRNYEYVAGLARYLTAMMPYDISFGGRYVLSRRDDIKAACVEEGIEYRYRIGIQQVFNRIHVIDVVTQINGGTKQWMLKESGYPKTLINNIKERKQKNDDIVRGVSDELICYMHEGKGKWIAVASSEDGLDTEFVTRFMPFRRYENMWWDK